MFRYLEKKLQDYLKLIIMEKYTIFFDTPQKMAADLTDNPQLQDFLATFLSIKDVEERQSFENRFWSKVTQFPSAEQAQIRASNAQISQRLSARMNRMAPERDNSFKRNERAFQGN